LTATCCHESSKIEGCTIPLSSCLALRLYSEAKPHNWQIADLQKGLIIVYKGVEAVGEGTGFGVPILVYSDEIYFSGSSQVYLFQRNHFKIIRKEFLMDTVERRKIGKVNLESRRLRAIAKYQAELYQKHRCFRFLMPLSIESLSIRMGVRNGFVKTNPVGKVIVTFSISQNRVRVIVDFSLLKRKDFKKILILNEQGARYFRRYSDSNGMELIDKQIGGWGEVDAVWASITDLQGRVGFRLWEVENSVLSRGREFLEGCLDWIGLDYEIDPRKATFEYEIEILGS